jgi:hypothetical protein
MLKVAFGLKAHSGWAALVVVGARDGAREVVDRRRVELVEDECARQPYHAAQELKGDSARGVVRRGVDAAHRLARHAVRSAIERESERGNEVIACGVLVVDPMPDWSTDEILAVHVRMHKAEGVLFRDALVRAGAGCGLKLVAIPEKLLTSRAQAVLGMRASGLADEIARLGKSVGPPWGKDQKDAALAAMVALQA